MKTVSKIILYTGVLLSLFVAGCDEYITEATDYYSFVVMSSGDSVSGYYILDGDPADQTYTFSTLDIGTSYFKFSKNLTSPISIRIKTDPSDTATSVDIFVYVNSDEAAYATDTITATGDTVSATVYYEFETSGVE